MSDHDQNVIDYVTTRHPAPKGYSVHELGLLLRKLGFRGVARRLEADWGRRG